MKVQTFSWIWIRALSVRSSLLVVFSASLNHKCMSLLLGSDMFGLER